MFIRNIYINNIVKYENIQYISFKQYSLNKVVMCRVNEQIKI